MMKRFLLTVILLLSACNMNPAYAADLPTKAPYQPPLPVTNWQGLYLDGYFQYGANVTGVTTVATTNPAVDLASAPRGPGVGGSLGYNFDLGNFVLGARADISYLNVSGSGTSVADSLSVSNATNYLGNLDVCAGLPLSADRRLLVYGCGGFAFGGAKPNLQVATIQAAASDTSTGWNAALGARYKFTQNFGAFMEGDWYQLGDRSLTATDSAGNVLATSLAKYHVVTQKFGMFWQF
jgi:outer membrane immunogenic protein